MKKDIDILKKEINFRVERLGIKELDLILGNFARKNLDSLSLNELEQLAELMKYPSLDLLNWFTREKQPPVAVRGGVFVRILAGLAGGDK